MNINLVRFLSPLTCLTSFYMNIKKSAIQSLRAPMNLKLLIIITYIRLAFFSLQVHVWICVEMGIVLFL